MPIDRNSAVPLKTQLTEDLRIRLADGEWPVGSKFPSLRTLASASEYGVAELTMQSAVLELQHEGLLESSTGKGRFVVALPTVRTSAGDASLDLEDLRAEIDDMKRRIEALERSAR